MDLSLDDYCPVCDRRIQPKRIQVPVLPSDATLPTIPTPHQQLLHPVAQAPLPPAPSPSSSRASLRHPIASYLIRLTNA